VSHYQTVLLKDAVEMDNTSMFYIQEKLKAIVERTRFLLGLLNFC